MAWVWVHVPHFAVAVARRQDPAFREVPVVVEKAGRVWDCSPDAWARGVRPGQRLREARTRSPEAGVWTWDPGTARALWESLAEGFRSLSPTVRSHPWDAWSLTSDPDQEKALLLVQEVLQRTRDLEVPAQVGWAAGPFVASVAARVVKPGQACLVAPGHEAAFLAPLPLRHLPLSRKRKEELEALGVETMGAFAQLPAASVGTRFGRQGLQAWHLAQGEETPLSPAAVEQPRVWVRWAIFDPPLEPDQTFRLALADLLRQLGVDLQARGLACQEVALEVTGESGRKFRVEHRVQETPGSPAGMVGLGEALLAGVRTAGDVRDGRIAELKVLARGLDAQRGQQLPLFPTAPLSEATWHHAVVELASRYPGCFWQGHRLDPDARLARQRAVWQPFMEEEG